MKQPWSPGFFVVLVALVIAGGVALVTQRQESAALRAEIDVMRMEVAELSRLKAENLRLRGKQIPAAELEGLRADHAALPRLRAELENLKKGPPAEVR